LEQLVLEELRQLLRYIPKHEKQFVRLVMDRIQEQTRDTTAKKRTAVKHRQRIAELDTLIERLYGDNVSGRVPDERYEKMSAKFDVEQAALKETVAALEAEIAGEENQAVNVGRFLSVVRRYTEIEKLPPANVHKFIDRIIHHCLRAGTGAGRPPPEDRNHLQQRGCG
jgi:site-specific DNA recombinase